MEIYRGKGVQPGIAIGPVFMWQRPPPHAEPLSARDPDTQWEIFLVAKEQADLELDMLHHKALTDFGEGQAQIVDVQHMMLHDDDFICGVEQHIRGQLCTAHEAVRRTGEHFATMLAGLSDPYMQARAADIRDICRRLENILSGALPPVEMAEPSIVLADDISPSETLQLDKHRVLAFVTRRGSVNSHAAILARMLGIPAVTQVNFGALEPGGGPAAAVDGMAGALYLRPDGDTLRQLAQTKARMHTRLQHLDAARGLPSVTRSGNAISLYANISGIQGVTAAAAGDAEGIGLLRSEFLFLGRSAPPCEDEQFEVYRMAAEKMRGKPVIIRTADIGADKSAPYLALGGEDNPALGYRGVRLNLGRPDLFRTQLRAILRAAAYGNVSVMFPLVTSVWEVRTCKKLLAQALRSLSRDGVAAGKVPVGVMIETPAAVMVADALAAECDFFSVGTNDLTQYTLAVDRQNSLLESFFDPRHPAMLAMLRLVAHSARRAGIPAGICGELAADTSLSKTFIRLGFRSLSVSPSRILELRSHIRSLDLSVDAGGGMFDIPNNAIILRKEREV